jgi:glycosyltransferase involved in cell wall biosynthesis
VRVVFLPSWFPTEEQPHAGCFLRTLARGLADAGVNLTVFFPDLRSLRTWRPGDGSGELIEQAEGPVRVLRWRGFRWWPRERHGAVAFTSAARRLMVEYVTRFAEPDLIHAHVVLPAGYAAARLADVWSVPFILTEHTGPFSIMLQTAWQRWQVRRAYRRASAVTAVSAFERDALRDAGIDNPINVIPNAVDPIFFEADPRGSAVSHVDRRPRFCTVASLHQEKAVDVVIRAIAAVPDATLVIAGDGPEREALEALAEHAGLAERVRFVGALRPGREVRDLIAASDVCVLASRAETFGVTLIEALACGKPVIATRCGGPPEIVTPDNGLLVDVDDVAGLSHAMCETARRLSGYDAQKIRDDCRERFSTQAVAGKYLALYERCINTSRVEN